MKIIKIFGVRTRVSNLIAYTIYITLFIFAIIVNAV